MKSTIFTVFMVLAFCFASAINSSAQTLTVRNAHSLVYDSNKNRILLFGGADEKQVYGDLWVLEKHRWKRLSDGEIEPRTFASLVYDEADGKLILFGGNKVLFGSKENPAEFFNDTCEYKKGKWRRLKTDTSPEPRAEAAIVYDQQKKRIILFGGYTLENGKLKRFGDTWEFRNDKWKKLTDKGVSPRNGAVLAFDYYLKKIVLFGGSTENKDYGEKTGETWILEGDEWKKLEMEQPANIFNSNMVFDEKNKQLFRFGGWNGKERINETWIFKNKTWENLNLKINPPARNHASMVYDSKSNKIILFGGHDGEKIFGDLWIFEKGKWYKRFEHSPIKRLDNRH